MSWSPRTTVASVVERDGRFLIVEETTRNGQVVFNQPAGHLDEGESLIDAVIRETREETAWGFEPEGLLGIYRWQVPPNGDTYLRYCFFGKCSDHTPDQPLDDGIIQAVWLSREELAARGSQLRSPMVLRCIDDYLDGKNYPLSILNDLG
ncbi:NUDIX hydrolase [Solemya velesiana gill symbiont]|uniref:Phosphatase NudJ n=1 Tax=Solemya velesiana gill symbiont TaxID=1918948 RepID=A0A1T2KS47_9GAMM|nr:NUDIX hydrolase [Solemya velesiana gill symbiont]OOZ35688.1 NUDIX hydrolase [Solemya velesiana gill symbiont]